MPHSSGIRAQTCLAIKQFHFDIEKAETKRKFLLNELEEIRSDA